MENKNDYNLIVVIGLTLCKYIYIIIFYYVSPLTEILFINDSISKILGILYNFY